jgi:hypothetical protein
VENRGLLVASGLVAGEALLGILIAGIVAMGVKLLPDEGFINKVEQARETVAQVEQIQGTGDERARQVAADSALLSRILASEGLVEKEIDAKIAAGVTPEKIKGKISALKTVADTSLVGKAPDWFGQAWLGFLVIIGLGFYMVRTSLKASKEGKGSGSSPPGNEGS